MTAHDRIARIARQVLHERFASIDDQSDALAAAIITGLGLTQFWAVNSGDGYQGDTVREHWDEARDDLAETIAAGDDDAYMVTAWFTGWERAE